MKTGIGIVSNKNVVCEKELIRNSLLPYCFSCFFPPFPGVKSCHPEAESWGGRSSRTMLHTWKSRKFPLKAEGGQTPCSPGWWLYLQGSNMHVPEGDPIQDVDAPHTRTGCTCMVGLIWETFGFLILALTVVKT